jgi:hypothetical protein
LLKEVATSCVDPGPRVCPAGYAQRGSSARPRWGHTSGPPMLEELRTQIGSRSGTPATARAPYLLGDERPAGIDSGARQFASSSPSSPHVVLSWCAIARFRRSHLPLKHANAEDEGVGWCCSLMPEQVYFAVTVAVHTAPNLAGTIPCLLRARPSGSTGGGRRSEVD